MMAYIERLELLGFFSGYPLIYLLVLSIAGKKSTRSPIKNKLVSLLPSAYALTGILYWGLQLRNLYLNYSLSPITLEIHFSFLKIWGLITIIFWIPLLRKRVVISLFHSLVFLYFILQTIYLQFSSASADKDFFRNDMKVYFDSILLNAATFLSMVILFFLISRMKRNKILRKN